MCCWTGTVFHIHICCVLTLPWRTNPRFVRLTAAAEPVSHGGNRRGTWERCPGRGEWSRAETSINSAVSACVHAVENRGRMQLFVLNSDTRFNLSTLSKLLPRICLIIAFKEASNDRPTSDKACLGAACCSATSSKTLNYLLGNGPVQWVWTESRKCSPELRSHVFGSDGGLSTVVKWQECMERLKSQ